MKIITAFLVALTMSALTGVAYASPGQQAAFQIASAASCAAGETYVKGYKKADGTVVSGYCRHNAGSAKDCGKGETYVHGYTKADGTQVKGYCRKQT